MSQLEMPALRHRLTAHDLRFYEKLPKLAPHNPGFRDLFANNPELAEATTKRNGTLQGAYLMIAARASDWTAVPSRDLTTPRSMRSSSGQALTVMKWRKSTYQERSNQTSFATLVMATRHRCVPVCHAWNSPRFARCSEWCRDFPRVSCRQTRSSLDSSTGCFAGAKQANAARTWTAHPDSNANTE
jgi:hypothetical protein